MNEIDEIIVTGGRPLHGSVRIQGSKNAALPVMAAALLSTGTSVLRGCPKISDVYLMEKILKYLGQKPGGKVKIFIWTAAMRTAL